MDKTILPKLKNISPQQWNNLTKKLIFFGHQSVGYNIIDGLNNIIDNKTNAHIKIQETYDPKDFDKPIFAHSKIGKNGEPMTKIDNFKNIMDSGVGKNVNIAFLKFCYVDITEKTNIDELFKYYVRTMDNLELMYPRVKFIHFTVPITSIQTGIKANIKKLIGKPLEGEKDNIKRNEFNRMLLKKYGNKLFDLAKFESIGTKGNKCIFTKNNVDYEFLCSEYTEDGGHLNKLGSIFIAKKLLNFLSVNQNSYRKE